MSCECTSQSYNGGCWLTGRKRRWDWHRFTLRLAGQVHSICVPGGSVWWIPGRMNLLGWSFKTILLEITYFFSLSLISFLYWKYLLPFYNASLPVFSPSIPPCIPHLPSPSDSLLLFLLREQASERQLNRTKQNTVRHGKSPHTVTGQGNLIGEKESQEQAKESKKQPLPLLGVSQEH